MKIGSIRDAIDVYNKFMKERLAFQTEMKALNHKVLSERKRLKDESSFFDKKLQILQNGFLLIYYISFDTLNNQVLHQ